jgi:hypothetical protein
MGFCAATYRDLTHREILLKNSFILRDLQDERSEG